ncbi:peptide/nickel transport system ATP-binding protein [Paenibacillus sp. UNCCL117]|uniref:ABC transporter ATP-binding protein n=1 Tax=unclassified Paenibacillus TaxID=185978 RepID=UPI000888DDA6|nr:MULTISPECIES: ABC transporter ATP-binding protein [unclassified Paenibacillus]SDC89848.1 peptide/nickel transport system ATP-binding protein [Paenibacillus sp. cl123]SFW28665.1 peptide/nickel transport system ATP-binding protein [Paenibacillus sp. UNCCL117]
MKQADKAMLRIQNLRVAYQQNRQFVNILDNLSFELKKGEIVSLLGESGSGKSTIAKALTGLLPPSATIAGGTLTVSSDTIVDLAGKRVPWERIRGRRIAMLYQDAQQALNPVLKIKDHFRETLLFHRLASANEVQDVSIRLLKSLNFSDPHGVLERYPFQLSGGMCQRICLALALCLKPAVLIADEPTSALDTVSQKEVLDLLKHMRKEQDLTVLLITHDIAVANAISDRVIVLNQGVIEEDGETGAVLTKPKAAYTRALLASRAQIAGVAQELEQLRPHEPLLEISRLWKTFHRSKRVLHEVDLTLHQQEILGILGESGCGKSTLARCIAGLESPSGGTIIFRGTSIGGLRGKSRRELCKRIQLVFQDARASLNPARTALELVQEPLRYHRIGGKREREALAKVYLSEVGIAGEMQHRRPPQLSTGQCQRIAIARALALQPEVLICDEAVSALDMSVQAQILALLHRLHRQYGFAILMISHDIRVLRSFCHNIAVMNKGSFCEVRQASRLLEESKQPYTQLLCQCAGDMEAGLG